MVQVVQAEVVRTVADGGASVTASEVAPPPGPPAEAEAVEAVEAVEAANPVVGADASEAGERSAA